jgi:hypothetical protein
MMVMATATGSAMSWMRSHQTCQRDRIRSASSAGVRTASSTAIAASTRRRPCSVMPTASAWGMA